MKHELMRAISKDLIDVRKDIEPLFTELRNRFHNIMRKHGIKWGTKTKGQAGTSGANPEWTIAKDAFVKMAIDNLEWQLLFDTPKDLLAYDEEEIDE